MAMFQTLRTMLLFYRAKVHLWAKNGRSSQNEQTLIQN
jgi:hypothetical protein